MLKIFRNTVYVMSAALFFLPSIIYAAPPPAGVSEVLVAMNKFDESYPVEKWDEALAATEEMEKLIHGIFVQAQLDDYILEEALEDLNKNVVAKDIPGVETAYIAFQKQYFNFVSHFDHDVHPILKRTEYYVMTGATDAYERKDYEELVREMKMATILIDHGKVVLTDKGVHEQEINQFSAKVSAMSIAAKKGDSAKTGELLEQLKSEYSSFMNR